MVNVAKKASDDMKKDSATRNLAKRSSKKLLQLILVSMFSSLFLISKGYSQTLLLNLSKGQSFYYDQVVSRKFIFMDEKTRLLSQNFPSLRSGEASTPLTLKVIDVFADKYRFEMRNGRTVILSPRPAQTQPSPAEKELLDLSESIRIVFDITNNGKILGITNFDEARSSWDKLIDLTLRARGQADSDETRRFVEKTFSSKEAASGALLNNIPYLFYVLGIDLVSKTKTDIETEMLIPFSEKPLKSFGTVSIMNYDKINKKVEVILEQQVRKDMFVEMMNELTQKTTGKPPPADTYEKIMKDGSIKDRIEFLIDSENGMSQSVKFLRAFVLPDMLRSDGIQFIRKK
jgi:hypothetical protein